MEIEGDQHTQPEKLSETKPEALEVFLASPQYASFIEDLRALMQDAVKPSFEGDVDVLRGYLRELLERAGCRQSEILTARLFWKRVAAEFNSVGTFGEIAAWTNNKSMVGNPAKEAKQLLDRFIEQVSPSVYTSTQWHKVALDVLREEFAAAYPDVVHTGAENTDREKQLPNPVETLQSGVWDPHRGSVLPTDTKPEIVMVPTTWRIPRESIKPGLVILIKDTSEALLERYEILGEPYQTPSQTWRVKARNTDSSEESDISLGELGIVPYLDGKWEPTRKPVEWFDKKEKSL